MGSYYMKWLHYSWEITNKLNTEFAERPMSTENLLYLLILHFSYFLPLSSQVCDEYLAMQWYCIYLNYSEGRQLNCLNNQPCSP